MLAETLLGEMPVTIKLLIIGGVARRYVGKADAQLGFATSHLIIIVEARINVQMVDVVD